MIALESQKSETRLRRFALRKEFFDLATVSPSQLIRHSEDENFAIVI
jgi:hypothetical protein